MALARQNDSRPDQGAEIVASGAEAENGTARRLVAAGIALIASGGFRALTVRDVAAMAAISFPSVQYHFPTKAHLVDAVLAEVARSHGATIDAIGHGERSPSLGRGALASIVYAVLWDWCSAHAQLTVAVHEMLLVAYRDPANAGPALQWIAHQHEGWTAIVERLGGRRDEDTAWFILELLVGLSLMTLGGGRPVEAGLANEEIIRYALAEPGGEAPNPPLWYPSLLEAAEREGLMQEADAADTDDIRAHRAAQKILEAGIRIVAEEGSSALTFRGVASRAEVAVSSVTNNFHTRENLVYRVYRRIQDEITEMGFQIGADAARSKRASEIEFHAALFRNISAGKVPLFLAPYDLVLAAARDPRLSREAWRIRLTRGIYLLIKRGKVPAPDLMTQYRSHVASLWTFGMGLLHHIRIGDPDARDRVIRDRLTDGFGRLRR